MEVQKEGLSATRSIVVNHQIEDVDDFQTRHKYLETGLKLRGKLTLKELGDEPVIININIANILQKIYGTGITGEVSTNS